MSKPTFSGWHGLLILPDEETAKRAEELGRNYPAAEYRVQASGAHITLYHAHFKDVPWEFVEGLVEDLQPILSEKDSERIDADVGIGLEMESLNVYANHYLYWDLSPTTPLLRLAHRAALSLAVFLDRGLHPERTPFPSDEKYENLRHYGYGHAGRSFRPHITIAVDTKGIAVHHQTNVSMKAFADRVVFARMGTSRGEIEEILL